jgi:hypothetical protein
MDPQPRVNPYIAGSPVTGTEMFYGREDVFAFIKRNLTGLHRDTPIVLYGQRRTGKTSVLYQLHRHLDPRYRCIFIDLHGLSLDGMGNLLYGVANSISRSLRRDYQLKVEVPDRSVFLADPRSAFETRFLDEVWSALGDDHLVLMIDEAVRLHEEVQAGRLEREVFEFLRHLMQHFTRLNFIFSLGSGLEEMAKDYAFLFSVSLYRRISFLEPAAARELITRPVRGHYEVTPQAVTKILQVTSGHPYYTQLVCHCMFDSWSRAPKPVMGAADVEAVLAEAIELGSANLTYVWEDSAPEEQALMAGVAAAMRHGTGPVIIDNALDAWHELGVRLPEREVVRALRSLTSREVMTGDQAYRFNVDLQRLWCEKHRHLDWVKDELADAIRQWHESTDPWPADTIPALATADGQKPEKAPARTKPSIIHNRYLIIAVAGIIAVAASLSATVLLLSNSAQGPSIAQSTSIAQSLIRLIPGGVPLSPQECHAVAPSNLWTMPGLVLELHCNVPELSGGNIYAYQLDNASDYKTAWQNFNQWWDFSPAGASTTCPPKGAKEGIVTWASSDLPEASRPVQECGMQTPSPGKTVPAYAWGYPSIGAFVLAQGPSGSSFAALHSWVTPKPVNLQNVIPADVRQGSSCRNAGTSVGAVAVFECTGLRNLPAGTIFYYLFSSPQLLSNGFSNFLKVERFTKSRECTTNSQIIDFLTECESNFTSPAPYVTGSIAEYVNTSSEPIIITTGSQQNVMAVMVGTNEADLLSYWKRMQWIVTGP